MSEYGRDNFSAKVIRLVSQRAGFICSRPDCGKRTTGPGAAEDKVVSIGVAAHINAASPGGPRYDPAQTNKERASSSNAIWLCQDDAKLIDSDPDQFPAETLRQWKQEYERKIAESIGKAPTKPIVEVSGKHIARGRGNVTGLDIRGPAIIKPGTRSIAEGEGNITGTRIGGPDK